MLTNSAKMARMRWDARPHWVRGRVNIVLTNSAKMARLIMRIIYLCHASHVWTTFMVYCQNDVLTRC